jgi:NAD(P)-dependent dehydrogenase (short-subunit alcohol dehydrogenase family)
MSEAQKTKPMNVLDRFRLNGKCAVITGASSGLGESIALAMSQAGARVALAGRRSGRIDALADRIIAAGGGAIAVPTDVTSPEECRRLADTAAQHFGRLHILVNCAGVALSVPATRETPEQFREVVETNLMGSYWMSQACVTHMGVGASIINISSVLGLSTAGLPQAAYASSKAAVLGLTRDLAQQWGRRKGIRVNALVPGYFLTEMTESMNEELLSSTVEHRVLLGRLGEVEECAAAAVFLASNASSFITGVGLPVDGGYLVT